MRQFKFRAWDTKIGKWVDGGYGFHILGEAIHLGGLFYEYFKNGAERLNDIALMQFTGLKDKNEKDIYAGDILYAKYSYFGDGSKFEICYGLGKMDGGIYKYMGFYLKGEDNGGQINEYWIEHLNEFEVIGNIFENPDLALK